MASRLKLIDNLLYHSDEFDSRLRVYIPSDPELQKQFMQTYHDSPLGIHGDRHTTYAALSREYFWKLISKHVRSWVRRCKHSIRFKSTQRNMAQCTFIYTIVLFILLVSTMSVNYQLARQERNTS